MIEGGPIVKPLHVLMPARANPSPNGRPCQKPGCMNHSRPEPKVCPTAKSSKISLRHCNPPGVSLRMSASHPFDLFQVRLRIEEDRIKSFAAECDPQPFHLDAAAAQRTMFQGLAASGSHTPPVTMRPLLRSAIHT